MQFIFMRKVKRFQKCSLRIWQTILFDIFFCDGPVFLLWKSFLESEAGWHSDWLKSSNAIHPRVQTIIWQRWGFLEVKEDEANEQHKSIIEALKAAAPEWTFEQINFVAGWRGAVVEDDFYNKLERLSVQAGKKDKILAAHVQCMCEVHDTVIRSYYQQIHGSSGADPMTLMENIREQVYV